MKKTAHRKASINLELDTCKKAFAMGGDSHMRIFILLTAGVSVLLRRLFYRQTVALGIPPRHRGRDNEGNSLLGLACPIDGGMPFKELVLQIGNEVFQAYGGESPREPVAGLALEGIVVLENIHGDLNRESGGSPAAFSFVVGDERISGHLSYEGFIGAEALAGYFQRLMEVALHDVELPVAAIDMISPEERERYLFEWNDTGCDYPGEANIYDLFRRRVNQGPGRVAVVFEGHCVTYGYLDRLAERLAGQLLKLGAGSGVLVALLMEPSVEMIAAILGVLRAGGAYVPLDPELPAQRIRYVLDDSACRLLVTSIAGARGISFASLLGLRLEDGAVTVTAPRRQIKDLDRLPIPDRRLVRYDKYHRHIGLSMFTNTISIQATRGCPYNCAYCHKIWPKTHMVRSYRHIADEVSRYYDLGVRRFMFVDDIFNLDKENSIGFFNHVVKQGWDLQLFFPAGLRGDILTPAYIDLMVEAGTVNLGLALETASPRLQRLIRKNLNLHRFKENISYLCRQYPEVVLELFIMHGFPGETEAEALETLEFVKSLQWVHFPYLHILKIYPHTDMEKLAFENGVSQQAIERSAGLAYHELPETLPFDKDFTRACQADFLNDYILSPQRLRQILPHQMALLTEGELVQKYDSYFPVDITCVDDLLQIAGMTREDLGDTAFVEEQSVMVADFDRKLLETEPTAPPSDSGLRVLLLDLSQYFSHDTERMLYDVVEAPLGLMYLLTYLERELGQRVSGKIAKSRVDFSDYEELRQLLEEFDPQVIGIRTLTFYSDFFHKTTALMRQWGFDGAIVAGGPYATSDYPVVLQDRHVDVVVMGEGEVTFCELIEAVIANDGQLPADDVLNGISGLAFRDPRMALQSPGRGIVFADALPPEGTDHHKPIPPSSARPEDPAYAIYTSCSTGRPKGVLVTQANVARLLINRRFPFSFDHRDVWTMFHSYNFDFSVWEIFGALLYGGRLVVVPKSVARDTRAFASMAVSHGVTVLNQTPQAFYNLADVAVVDQIPLELRYVIFGGDALDPGRLKAWRHLFPDTRLVNMYGITETTVHVTFKEILESDMDGGISNIGAPIPTTTLYVMDPDLQLVPAGGEGEIVVGGLGLARGYLNRPELTAQRFIHHPHIPEERVYRSGDLGRLTEGGEVIYLGRMDRQVQVRGFRVELLEIEYHLRQIEGIADAVVVHRNLDSDTELTGYVVGTPELEAADIKERLSGHLPYYMIPSFIIPIGRIPLTPNGKVDISALPAPDEELPARQPQSLTPVQETLLNLWAGILELKPEGIGLDANFFDLGGHSLKATKLLLQIQRDLNVKVPLVEVFDKFSIRELATYVELHREREWRRIPSAPPRAYYETSSAQKRLHALQALDPHSTAYNIPLALDLRGEVDVQRLESTFGKLILRHESLRTSFALRDGRLVQEIHPHVPFSLDSQEAPQGVPQGWLRQFIAPFSLETPPLLRVALLRRGPGVFLLMVDMHHIIADGISVDIMVRDFMQLYSGAPIDELELHYKDYCCWLTGASNQERILRQREYWLAEFPGKTPVIELPVDYPRPRMLAFDGASIELTLNRAGVRSLEELADSTGTTLYMVLLALFFVWLFRLTGQEALVAGTPVAGRGHPDLEPIIGMFVNTLPLKNYPAASKTLRAFIQEIKGRTLEAFENQEYPLEDLVEAVGGSRDGGGNPLFDVMFSLQNLDIRTFQLPGLDVEPIELHIDSAKSDLILRCIETGGGLNLSFNYNTHLFKGETVRCLADCFTTLCRRAAAEIESPLGELTILSDEEKRAVLEDFNNTRVVTLPRRGLYELFLRHCTAEPDHVAVAHRDHLLTYEALDRRARILGNALRCHGVTRDSIVAILLPPSNELLVAVWAVIAAGGGFLPLDLRSPQKRIDMLLSDCRAPVLLTGENAGSVTGFSGITIDVYEAVASIRESGGNTDISQETGLAYMISTSGTTGKPKGVLVNRESLVNYITWFSCAADISSGDRTALLSSFAFDLGYTAVFGAMANGCQLHLPTQDTILTPGQCLAFCADRCISFLKMTPSLLATLAHAPEFGEVSLRRLRLLVLGGEEIDTGDVAALHRVFPHVRVMNHYGPAESCIGAIARFIDFTNYRQYIAAPTIGSPIHNIQAFVLDSRLQPVPLGVRGELYLAGAGLARGYLNDPDTTAQRFLRCPWDRDMVLYRTGDMARRRDHGHIEFLGRMDRQVKIRGFRVECGEVELCLKSVDGIADAVVLGRRDGAGNHYLCAYYIAGEEFDPLELRRFMEADVPDYMIPSFFRRIDAIPLNSNGKLDHAALPGLGTEAAVTGGEYQPPRDSRESLLARVWGHVLGRDPIGIHHNFFSLGGDSIKAIQIVSRVRESGFQVKMRDIFQHTTIAQLAPVMDRAGRVPQQTPVSGDFPLTPVQQRFFQSHTIAPHHYNQSVVLQSNEEFCPDAIQAALTKIQEHHDGLRLVFKRSAAGVKQEYRPVDIPLDFDVVDGNEPEDAEAMFLARAQELQGSFDLDTGPLMKARLFQMPECRRLLVVIHHLVVDTVSWRIIIEDFHYLYSLAKDHKPLELPAKSDSFKVWAGALWDEALDVDTQKEKEYWQAVETRERDHIPVDFPDGTNLFEDAASVSFTFDRHRTVQLETEVHTPFKTSINDILLTALALALKDTFTVTRAAVSLEGHGREDILPDLDVSRTTGWFTSVFPVVLDAGFDDPARQIKEIKERLHRVPRNGIGYGILRYLSPAGENTDMSFQLAPAVSFNYLGRFEAPSPQPLFQVTARPAGDTVSPKEQRAHDLDVVAAIQDNRLQVTVIYGERRFRGRTARMLADRLSLRLRELVDFCVSCSRREPTPCDFTYKNLSIRQVDGLNRRYSIQDIYRLTPMQEGMLFHALYDLSSAAYFRQTSFRFKGELERVIVERSLLDLVERYEILRTAFVHEDSAVPLQIVLREAKIDFHFQDLRGLGGEQDRQETLRLYQEADRRKKFHLAGGYLLRVAMFPLNMDECVFVWSHHHILMDGWCNGMLIGDFFEIANRRRRGENPALPPVPPFKSYLQWLDCQDAEGSLAYWRRYLQGFEKMNAVPGHRASMAEDREYLGRQVIRYLEPVDVEALNGVAVDLQVTVSTLLQVCWALLLGKYNGCRDVVFGLVVSGRPGDIPNVESMVGLFINTVPVRVQWDGDTPLESLARRVQERAVESESHHYCSLADIQSQTPLKQNLFHHIFQVGNYPVSPKTAGDYGISDVKAFEQNNYPFALVAGGTDDLSIECKFDARRFEPELMERLADNMNDLLSQVIGDPRRTIDRFTIKHRLQTAESEMMEPENGDFCFDTLKNR
jgi:amino acid adenylation domain-containing protein/non-ribosomal peptide synthase protein (TIGR01720 family)